MEQDQETGWGLPERFPFKVQKLSLEVVSWSNIYYRSSFRSLRLKQGLGNTRIVLIKITRKALELESHESHCTGILNWDRNGLRKLA